MIVTILGIICATLLLVYILVLRSYDYWKKRGVNGPKPWPFIGNLSSAFTQARNMAYDIQDLYEAHKSTENFVGIYNCCTPQLLITDIDLIRRIMVADFKHFHDNEISKFLDRKSDMLFGYSPFVSTGDEWKKCRAEISPGFTINRVKAVLPVTNKVCSSMIEFIEEKSKITTKDGIDGKDLCFRFTCEVVSNTVLGLDDQTFTNKPSVIMDMSKRIFIQSPILIFQLLLMALIPSLHKFKKMRFIPKQVEQFFIKIMDSSLNQRKDQIKQGSNEVRHDFINYLLQLQEKKNLTMQELAAHTMTYVTDGIETLSGILSHCLLMLGRDEKRQDVLRREILEKLEDTNDFDSIMGLPYLDACIHETLRLVPPVANATRLCTESIDFENKNGKVLNVAVGTPVILPIHAIMVDKQFYKDPTDFVPERFVDGGLKKCKEQGIYFGFGAGPRICLGMRFALAQMKAALVHIIRNYNVRINPRTRKDLRFDPSYFLLRLDGGIWLDFDKIN
ncbi:probable cytochrome P450 28d1 [Stomoxys calcitrans]|uniref:Cytochrome P450 n=1 Tax=Stomoxys calcitrans TaxID=35570 RepID=A0A1I8P837_STOCA|nr:probable cytochrome P450 28d1 [Stomoxys calcitrans]